MYFTFAETTTIATVSGASFSTRGQTGTPLPVQGGQGGTASSSTGGQSIGGQGTVGVGSNSPSPLTGSQAGTTSPSTGGQGQGGQSTGGQGAGQGTGGQGTGQGTGSQGSGGVSGNSPSPVTGGPTGTTSLSTAGPPVINLSSSAGGKTSTGQHPQVQMTTAGAKNELSTTSKYSFSSSHIICHICL